MPIIQVQNLSKSYIINHEGQERYIALRDVITNKAKKLIPFPRSFSPSFGEIIQTLLPLVDKKKP